HSSPSIIQPKAPLSERRPPMAYFTLICRAALGLAGAVFLLPIALHAAEPDKDKNSGPDPAQVRRERLDKFRQLTPVERLRLLEKLAKAGKYFHKATRGSVRPAVVERGVIDATTVAEVVCSVKSKSPQNPVATSIKWVVEDGTFVKRGDRLVDFDAST